MQERKPSPPFLKVSKNPLHCAVFYGRKLEYTNVSFLEQLADFPKSL